MFAVGILSWKQVMLWLLLVLFLSKGVYKTCISCCTMGLFFFPPCGLWLFFINNLVFAKRQAFDQVCQAW